MEPEKAGTVEVTFADDSFPKTVFANHAEVVGMQGYTTITFYAIVASRAAQVHSDPQTLKGRPVAQVVMPGGKWAELIANITKLSERAQADNGGADEDGSS